MVFVGLVAANVAAWIWAWFVFADRPALVGTAVLAYTLGLRHAFDADHIAAIDNAVRKLLQRAKAASSVGLYFSLGHSTVVVAGSVAFAAAAATMRERLDAVHELGGLFGTGLSALFLFAIAAVNLVDLRGIWAGVRQADDGDAIASTPGRGVLARVLRPLFELVSSSWHMYPIGLLFGLAFDTATEIGLLTISAEAAGRGLSLSSLLVFPALFAAGMSLLDTADSALMSRAYGWALVQPSRKLRYNLFITAASAGVAIFVGAIEVSGLIGRRLDLKGQVWNSITRLNDSVAILGCAIVVALVASWFLAVFLHRFRRSEQPFARRDSSSWDTYAHEVARR